MNSLLLSLCASIVLGSPVASGAYGGAGAAGAASAWPSSGASAWPTSGASAWPSSTVTSGSIEAATTGASTGSAAAAAAASASASAAAALVDSLELAKANPIERISLLAEAGGNSSFKFDLDPADAPPAPEGSVVGADSTSFFALVGLDASVVKFNLGPCSLIVPHWHPRADELIVTTQGTVFTQFLTETGSQVISNNISEYETTIFPAGAIHYELNPTCQNATFLGYFNSENPGTSVAAPAFFSFEEQAILAPLGNAIDGQDIAAIERALPAGPVAQVKACLASCGLPASAKRSLTDL